MDELLFTAVASGLGSAALHGIALASSAPPQLPGFLNSLAPVINHYGVWAIVLFVFLEDFGVPVPGETVLIAGAVFAGTGHPNIVMVYIAGFLAAVAGDNLGYAIGRFGGRALVDRFGKYVFLTPERMDKAENFFNNHGGKIIVIARFVEGLRQANGLIAGIIEMHWLKFVAFNALGAALWVGTWVSVGYFAGQHITAIYDAITRYSLYAAIAAAVVIVAWIGLRIRKRRQRRAQGTVSAATKVTVEDAPARDAVAQSADAGTAAEDALAEPPGEDGITKPLAEDGRPESLAADGSGESTARDHPGGAAGDGPQDNSARS